MSLERNFTEVMKEGLPLAVARNGDSKPIHSEANSTHTPFELVHKKKFNFKENFFISLITTLGFTGAVALVVILFFVAYNGIRVLSWEFITQSPIQSMTKGGIFPVIVGTVLLTMICMIMVIPVGVTTAIFLAEYSKPGLLLNMVNMSIYTLAGVPSVVFGLFGLTVFVITFHFGMSLIAGSFTLAIMVLPYIISTAEEAIKTVPYSFREASLACGTTKWQTIRRVVLPTALPGILTGAILGTAKVSGETAPIMFTAAAFFTPGIPRSIFEPVMALPYHIYVLATAGTNIEATRPIQYGTALTLIVLVLGMNLLGIILRSRQRGRRAW
jgi:phosphate transport system permease protein